MHFFIVGDIFLYLHLSATFPESSFFFDGTVNHILSSWLTTPCPTTSIITCIKQASFDFVPSSVRILWILKRLHFYKYNFQTVNRLLGLTTSIISFLVICNVITSMLYLTQDLQQGVYNARHILPFQ